MTTTAKKVAPTPAKAADPKRIVVEGRTVEVKKPTAEQLMAWESTISAIASMQEASEGDYEKIRTHMNRFYRIAAGVLVNAEDKEWLEDARLEGVITIEKDSVIGMMNSVLEVYKDEFPGMPTNRAEKRAAVRKRA